VVAGHELQPRTLALTLSRASLLYGVGLRQVYFSVLLFAWLAGPWSLVVTTILYFLFIYYVESVDRVRDIIMMDGPH